MVLGYTDSCPLGVCLGYGEACGGSSRNPYTTRGLQIGEKLEVGSYSVIGLLGCGPCLFVLIYVILILLVSLPIAAIGVGAPTWLYVVLCFPAAALTIALMIGMSANARNERLIKDAELKRAKEELYGKNK